MSEIKVNQLGHNEPKLKKELKSRHITMISLGGTIGTGLFLASGGAIAQAGPEERIACLCLNWCYGVLPNDELRRDGCLYAIIRFI